MLETTMIHRVHNAIATHPERNALFVDGCFYTYRELGEYVSATRKELMALGVKRGDFVGILVGRDFQSYIFILSLLSLGAAYVPLNKKNPADRTAMILKESNVGLVLSGKPDAMLADVAQLLTGSVTVVVMEKMAKDGEAWMVEDLVETEFAYLIFTSGSTGVPKGVPIKYSNLNAFFHYFLESEKYHFDKDDRFLQMFELTFDPSVMAFFMPLCIGACCYIVPEKGVAYINIAKLLRDHELTVAVMVPSVIAYLERFMKELNLEKLKYSFFCGEGLPERITEKWSHCVPNGEIVNIYGPTEATIVCTEYTWLPEVSADEAFNGIVPIGNPMAAVDTYVVDESGKCVGQGEKGELCLGGPQVFDAYWENEEKTTSAFFTVIDGEKTQRVYRTGDICFVNHAGHLIYCGRLDSQVKIDGYRIELGDIESHARDFLDKYAVSVLAIKNKNTETELHLFVENLGLLADELQAYLAEKLPLYMCPKHIHDLDVMPINSSGKMDRKSLRQLVEGEA